MMLLQISLVLSLSFLVSSQTIQSFGVGRSQIHMTTDEYVLLDYTVSSTAQTAALTFFWITGDPISGVKPAHGNSQLPTAGNGVPCYVDYVLWRFYLDGEATASLGPVSTSQAAFVGHHDPSADWDNDFFGKNSAFGGWHVNLLIPFSKSIRVTLQYPPGMETNHQLFAMARGVENLPLSLGGLPLPNNARLQMVLKESLDMPVLAFHDLVNIASGPGRLLGTMIDITSKDNGTLNTLEGCWHAYLPGTQYEKFPGLLLGTGSEDYPESAYYFNAGPYRGPTSGLTLLNQGNDKNSYSTISFYKLHHKDPIFFGNGFQFQWRNGDVTDPATGQKCTAINGNIIGHPGVSNVSTIVYLYTW